MCLQGFDQSGQEHSVSVGSWWAYKELGWGGWWFWDPVENASFMPWLAGTALIHSLSVTEKRGLLKSWTVLLAILAFSLSLVGTFLVRSGVVVSVHAFASDPTRGIFILGFLAVVVGAALTLYAWRAPRLVAEAELNLFSREGLMLINNVLLVTACGAVLLGTLYPLAIDALGAGKISVGPPYFNTVFVPLMLPLFVLVGVVGVVPWKRGRMADTLRRLRTPLLIAAIGAGVLPLLFIGQHTIASVIGAWLAVWMVLGVGLDLRQRVMARRSWKDGVAALPAGAWGMTLAHVGLAVWTLGVAYTSAFAVEKDARLLPGQSLELSGYRFTLQQASEVPGPNYRAQQATVDVERNDQPVARLHPQKRFFPSQQRVQTESAMDVTPLRDLYVALGESYEDGSWSLRVYVKPMMRWVWFGGVLMALGGALALSDPRYRLARAAARRETIVAEAA